MEIKFIAILIHILVCYGIGFYGRKKKIGFNDAFLLSFMFPLVGIIVVLFSKDKDAPEIQPARPVLKPELTDAEQSNFSELLKQYHKKKITKEEFETLAANFK